MATVRREIAVSGSPDGVWQAVRDFGAVHTRVAPGFLTELRMDKGDRIVTFFNGLVARERLVTVDDQACRLVYAVVEGRPQHYNAAVEVQPGLPHDDQPSLPQVGEVPRHLRLREPERFHDVPNA